MASTLKTYLVVSSLPIVVEDGGDSISYQSGATFTARDTNSSIVRLLSDASIIETTGASPTQGFTLVTGPAGPVGPAGPAGAGEANTTSSAGGTVALPLAKSVADLPFRGLTAGANITLTPSGTDVTIAATDTGEANTTSSAGGTVALPLTKSVADLPFRGLTAGANITLTPSGTDVTIAAVDSSDESNILAFQVFS